MSNAILIVEDETILAKNIRIFFERAGYEARVATSAEEALQQLDAFQPDLVLLDFQLPGIDGLEMLASMRSREDRLPVVMLTGQGNVDLAVRAMKLGAVDFLSKPVALQHLLVVVDRLLEERRKDAARNYLKCRSPSGLAALLGESEPMKLLRSAISKLLEREREAGDGERPVDVLITGETGTGKELVARTLHCESAVGKHAFIELNCSTVPPGLLEAELFGYERGAFAGAAEKRLGLIEAASGGTLFIDEVGDMDLPTQARLLDLLEKRTARRMGSQRDQLLNVRVVAASSQPLAKLVEAGRFRADLFFRLRRVQLDLPPLRERGRDILLLARHILEQQAARYRKPGLDFSEEAEAALMKHQWLGNVRELRNLIEQAVLLTNDTKIFANQLSFVSQPSPDSASTGQHGGGIELDEEIRPLSEVERGLLVEALQRTSWNVTRAARLLGISRDTLRYRIEKHNLSRLS